ncbi:hercynylcysteine sulfoxide lyase [Bacillus licheniformis]|nr:hercynylcysteine sulfoxide lyase [Bacillus licheniformis]
MKHPFDNFRSLFPKLSDHVHLAACSGSALALPVAKAVDEYQNGLLTAGADWKAHLDKMDETKEKFARLIGAEKEEIAVLPSVSDAVAAVAAAMPQPPRRRQIAFTDIDFPAVGQIWLAQDRFKDHLIIIQSEDGMIDLEQYEKDVTDQTLLTCVPHAGYRNGFKQDIKQIARDCSSERVAFIRRRLSDCRPHSDSCQRHGYRHPCGGDAQIHARHSRNGFFIYETRTLRTI